jgi:hypothetical protein
MVFARGSLQKVVCSIERLFAGLLSERRLAFGDRLLHSRGFCWQQTLKVAHQRRDEITDARAHRSTTQLVDGIRIQEINFNLQQLPLQVVRKHRRNGSGPTSCHGKGSIG